MAEAFTIKYFHFTSKPKTVNSPVIAVATKKPFTPINDIAAAAVIIIAHSRQYNKTHILGLLPRKIATIIKTKIPHTAEYIDTLKLRFVSQFADNTRKLKPFYSPRNPKLYTS